MAKFEGTIYRNPLFWEGVLDRLIRTAGQAIVASAAASLFTGAGLVAFGIFMGVALLSSLGTSLAAPERVLLGASPEDETPDYEGWSDGELDH